METKISKKAPIEDNRLTLSAIDKNIYDNFAKQTENLGSKKEYLEKLLYKKGYTRNKYTTEYHDLCKEIKSLEQDISNIENRKYQTEYLIKATPFFIDYTSTKNISIETTSESGFMIKKTENNKGRVCQEYMKNCIGSGHSLSTKSKEYEFNNELTCEDCNTEMIINPKESYATCPTCGEMSRYQDNQNNKGEYSEEVEVLSQFAYKRINHFKEWISALIGREGSGPSREVLDKILIELKKDRVEHKEQVTEERIKGYLKKLGYPKLYDHSPTIIYKICGIKPPEISKELEEKLIEMFEQIQVPFEKFAPAKRKNFLSYSYTLHKMCQLLQQDHLLSKLPLLKSREKLYQQDLVWKQICKCKGWLFIPSL